MLKFLGKIKKTVINSWTKLTECIKNKIGKKRFIIIVSAFVVVVLIVVTLLIAGIKFNLFCSHSWQEATCTSARICVKCNKEEGDALEHNWAEADCELPKTCKLCGAIDGEALGHIWEDATCEMPKICSVCQKADGKPLGHNWQEANCETSRTCSTCGESDGKAIGHKWEDATCDKPKTCLICKKTEGKAKGHKWQEATIDKPKTCSVCNKTEGKILDYEYIGTGKITTDSGGLNVRKNPNVDSDKITNIPKDTIIKVYDCNNSNWYYVEYDGKYGYSSSEFITLTNNSQHNNNNYSSNNSSDFSIEEVVAILKNPRAYGIDVQLEGNHDISIQSSNGVKFIQFIYYSDNEYSTTMTTAKNIKSLEYQIQYLKDKNVEPDEKTLDLLYEFQRLKEERENLYVKNAGNIQGAVDVLNANYSVLYCVVDPSREYVWNEDVEKAKLDGLCMQVMNGEVIYNLYDIIYDNLKQN